MLSAAVVILGVSLEPDTETHSRGDQVTEPAEHRQGEHRDAPSSEHAGAEVGESALMATLESPAGLLGLAAVSAGLAALVWRHPRRTTAAAVGAFATAAGALDVLELTRHLAADRDGLAGLAAVILISRILAVAGALALWRAATPRATATAHHALRS